MNEEEIKLLNKIEELPRELNIEIRGLILAEICLRKENKYLKEQQKEFINYLKSMLSSEKDNFSVARVKDVLEKYKEVIDKLKNY